MSSMQSEPAGALVHSLAAFPVTGDGSQVEVADGVFWLRMPMKGGLDHVNVWAIADDEGWTLVDTGLRTPETAEAWRHAFQSLLSERPVRRIIVTHLHPDHCGMAGWLTGRTGATLWMTRLEYLMLRVLASDTGREAPAEGIAFYRAMGWDEPALDRYRARFGEFGKMLYPIPNAFHCIRDGSRIDIGGREWEVVVGQGHSPEHACLYSRDLKLLISGDQVLPRISSNISVHPLEPEADPLSDWLRTLAAVKDRVADETLILPAHGEPFLGLHHRIDQLIQGHESALVRLLEMLDEPKRVVDVFGALFRREITAELLGMATGEGLAHLHCLLNRGLASRRMDDRGVMWWESSAEEPPREKSGD